MDWTYAISRGMEFPGVCGTNIIKLPGVCGTNIIKLPDGCGTNIIKLLGDFAI